MSIPHRNKPHAPHAHQYIRVSASATKTTMLSGLPARLRAARDECGKTNRQLADEVGKDESTVSLWMSGGRTPRMKNLEKLAQAMGKELGDLWEGPQATPANAAQQSVLDDMTTMSPEQQEAIAALVRAAKTANRAAK